MERTKTKLRKILRKQKFLIHIIVVIVGILLMGWGYFTYKSTYLRAREDFHQDTKIQYDILIGIGGGFASSALVTILLLAVLSDESEESQRLQEWGIRTVYEERSKIKIRLENKTSSGHLDFIAFGLSYFWGGMQTWILLLKKSREIDGSYYCLKPLFGPCGCLGGTGKQQHISEYYEPD